MHSRAQEAAPSAEEAQAAAAAAESEQLVLEAMCEDDDEVMELRTGMVTPVQVYLRFKVGGWVCFFLGGDSRA